MRDSFQLKADDGFALAADHHEAASVKAPVVIAPATGVPRRHYAALGAWLAERGFPSLLFDYRGIAGSAPRKLRGFKASAEDWGLLDLAAAIRWMSERYSAKPLLVAHSIGGQLLGITPERHRIRGALFIAVQSGYWGHWSGALRAAMWMNWHLGMPLITRAFGYLPMKRLAGGEDLPREVALQWARWGRHPEYILSSEPAKRERGFEQLAIPIGAFGFSDDGYAPKASVEAILRHYAAADSSFTYLSPEELGKKRVGHFGAFRPEMSDTLWPRFLTALEELKRA